MNSIRVSSKTSVTSLAGSIIKLIEGGSREIETRAIGASSVNQMIKAIACARKILREQEKFDLYLVPTFANSVIKGEEKTVIVCNLTIVEEKGSKEKCQEEK